MLGGITGLGYKRLLHCLAEGHHGKQLLYLIPPWLHYPIVHHVQMWVGKEFPDTEYCRKE